MRPLPVSVCPSWSAPESEDGVAAEPELLQQAPSAQVADSKRTFLPTGAPGTRRARSSNPEAPVLRLIEGRRPPLDLNFTAPPKALAASLVREASLARAFALDSRPAVVIFGSARTPEAHEAYENARRWGETMLLANVLATAPSLGAEAIGRGLFSMPSQVAVLAAMLGPAFGIEGAARIARELSDPGAPGRDVAVRTVERLAALAGASGPLRELFTSALCSGAGPGIMEAVIAGYVDALARLCGELGGLPEALRQVVEIRGSRIKLEKEQETSTYFEADPMGLNDVLSVRLQSFQHFDPRREALMLRATGIVAAIGGIGSLNEVFAAMRKGFGVLIDDAYYGTLMDQVTGAWDQRGFTPDAKDALAFEDGLEGGMVRLAKVVAANRDVQTQAFLQNEHFIAEMPRALDRLASRPCAVSLFGSPRLEASDAEVGSAARITSRLLRVGVPVRVGGEGALLDAVSSSTPERSRATVQAVLQARESSDTPAVPQGVDVVDTVRSPNAHKIMMYENSDAYVFAPGGDGVFDELFEVWCLIQTKKLPARPIVLVGESFFGPILERLWERMANTAPATISKDDLKLVHVVADEGAKVAANPNPPYVRVDESGAVALILAARMRRIAAK